MNGISDLYAALVGVCATLILGGSALLIGPRVAPPAVVPAAQPLRELWLLGVVVLGVGATLGALLLLRAVQ